MPDVAFEHMTDAEFRDFMELILPPYAAERAVADHMPLDAAERFAREQHDRLLPNGHETAGHRFLRIVAEGTPAVGGLWLWIDDASEQAFLYNITIFAPYRHQGFASAALSLVERLCRDSGCRALGLNVFASNEAALALYRKVGFRSVASYWNKALCDH